MSADTAAAQSIARATRSLLKGAGAQLAGKKRGRDRRVRRDSYDVDDRRAQVWAPIGDGTKRGELRWIDALVRTAKEYDVVRREAGKRGPLTPYGIRVFEELLKLACFKTGRLEPTISTIQERTRFARATVVRALARLKAHGFLQWVRRSRRTGNDGEAGPQREQTSNAYFFDLARLARGVGLRFRQLLGHRETAARARGDLPPLPPPPPLGTPTDLALREALAGLGAGIMSASS